MSHKKVEWEYVGLESSLKRLFLSILVLEEISKPFILHTDITRAIHAYIAANSNKDLQTGRMSTAWPRINSDNLKPKVS